MCVICRWNKTYKEKRETKSFCTHDWFSADCARTHAARVIRRRLLVVRAHKAETERGGAESTGELGHMEKTVCVGVCAVCNEGRGTEGRFSVHVPLLTSFRVTEMQKGKDNTRIKPRRKLFLTVLFL